MNNTLPCGKLVKNLVEKFVKKSWNKAVQIPKLGISAMSFSHMFVSFSTFTRKCGNKMNTFCTRICNVSNLLGEGFPLFPQTSTITITNLYK